MTGRAARPKRRPIFRHKAPRSTKNTGGSGDDDTIVVQNVLGQAHQAEVAHARNTVTIHFAWRQASEAQAITGAFAFKIFAAQKHLPPHQVEAAIAAIRNEQAVALANARARLTADEQETLKTTLGIIAHRHAEERGALSAFLRRRRRQRSPPKRSDSGDEIQGQPVLLFSKTVQEVTQRNRPTAPEPLTRRRFQRIKQRPREFVRGP